ncbi:MAG TPA: hypothetical protein VFW95_08480 [Candidatus Limnocylindria bacterium]|nr:hypothetical protein [Candidatus Limnocylindria bacterium]
MTAIVVRHLRLSKPVDEVAAEVLRTFPAAFRARPGFRSYYLSKVDDDRADVVMVWDSVEDAERAAEVIGPTAYQDVIAPAVAGDEPPRIGEAVVEFNAE